MPSGTGEPDCRDHPAGVVPTISTAMSGADVATWTVATAWLSSYDAPSAEATKIVAHATIHPTVNGEATAGRVAGSTAVN